MFVLILTKTCIFLDTAGLWTNQPESRSHYTAVGRSHTMLREVEFIMSKMLTRSQMVSVFDVMVSTRRFAFETNKRTHPIETIARLVDVTFLREDFGELPT